jgi:amino acid transporter
MLIMWAGFWDRIFNYWLGTFHLICIVLCDTQWWRARHGLGSAYHSTLFWISPEYPQWLVASIFILTVGLSMAELASAAPTSGGVSLVYLHTTDLIYH